MPKRKKRRFLLKLGTNYSTQITLEKNCHFKTMPVLTLKNILGSMF
jgi:hypothetical protein